MASNRPSKMGARSRRQVVSRTLAESLSALSPKNFVPNHALRLPGCRRSILVAPLAVTGTAFDLRRRQEERLYVADGTFFLEVVVFTGEHARWRAARPFRAVEVKQWLRGVGLEAEMAWLPISDKKRGGGL